MKKTFSCDESFDLLSQQLSIWYSIINSIISCSHHQFSQSVASSCLWHLGLQHARPPCPSPTPGVHSNSCPLSWWYHPAISSSCHLLLLPPVPPSIRVFSNESTLRMRWPKYWSFSFSISPSNEYPGLISFRMDWLDLLAVHCSVHYILQTYISYTRKFLTF